MLLLLLTLASARPPMPENRVTIDDDRITLWRDDDSMPNMEVLVGPKVSLVRAAHLTLAIGAIGIALPLMWRRRDPWTLAVRRLTAARGMSVVIPALTTAAVVGLHGVIQTPTPTTPDEFSNLLLADTVAHGRLANSTPELWPHFETIAVLMEPHYASKYPPAQGAFMAVGQLLGHPWFGIWLQVVLATAAFAWACRRWYGPRWSMVGGLLLAFHPGIMGSEHYYHAHVNYSWAHGYFGGGLSLLGGSLLLGTLGRRRKSLVDLCLFSLGLGLLAHTRPLEGLLVAIPCTVQLLWQLRRSDQLRSALVPLASFVVPALLLIPLYNQAVTGSSTTFPHRLYAQQYSAAAMFVFQEPQPFPAYENRQIRGFYRRYQRRAFRYASNHLVESRLREVAGVSRYFGWPGLLGLWGLLLYSDRRRVAPVVAILGATSAGLLVMSWHPHYFGPAAGSLLLLNVGGLAALQRELRPLAMAIAGVGLLWLPLVNQPGRSRIWPEQRKIVKQELEKRGGQHLVIVRGVQPFRRWVQNGADLENAPIVWARARKDNDALLDHYEGRDVWLIDADARRPMVIRRDPETLRTTP